MNDTRELLAKATPRPWAYFAGYPPWLEGVLTEAGGPLVCTGSPLVCTGSVYGLLGQQPVLYKPDNTDAALIVAAVNSYEALLAVAEAAREFWRGNTHDSPASDPLCFALARLDALRVEER